MKGYTEAVETARTYYNSADADNFYAAVWGGEDIHVGLYHSPGDSIETASRRTVAHMGQLAQIGPTDRVADFGAGYGGAARSLARAYGCRVDCLNLSERQNERNRRLNAEAGLDHLIRVFDGSYEAAPLPSRSYTVVWSQDAFLHSGARERALAEAARILGAGGRLILTDPMQRDQGPDGDLGPVLERLKLTSMASPAFYCDAGQRAGFHSFQFEDRTEHLILHYQAVLSVLAREASNLEAQCDPQYLQNMKSGLAHWINAGRAGLLTWGIIRMQMP